MPSHMTALGFPITTEQDFRHYVYQATEFGQKIETRNGSYTLWEVGEGIELWVQTNLHRRLIGMNPHFSGSARMRAGLTSRIPRYEHSILDGAFHAWAEPSEDDPEHGVYPFVFDVPDYDTYDWLSLPTIAVVQIAAFAHELQCFENEDEYMAAQGATLKFAEESFVPSGLFHVRAGTRETAQAQAVISGHVLAATEMTNPVTCQRFYWVKVRTLGGEVDVVADPQVVRGKELCGGVVRGAFWLSGRVIEGH
jgi:hypothetical protein